MRRHIAGRYFEEVVKVRLRPWVMLGQKQGKARGNTVRGNYAHSFNFDAQLFAANGYVVLYTNPRGSTSC